MFSRGIFSRDFLIKTLCGKEPEKHKNTYQRGGKIESITPLALWLSLRPGDIIAMRPDGQRRKVLSNNNGMITLKKIRKSQYPAKHVVYTLIDRHFFKLVMRREDKYAEATKD